MNSSSEPVERTLDLRNIRSCANAHDAAGNTIAMAETPQYRLVMKSAHRTVSANGVPRPIPILVELIMAELAMRGSRDHGPSCACALAPPCRPVPKLWNTVSGRGYRRTRAVGVTQVAKA